MSRILNRRQLDSVCYNAVPSHQDRLFAMRYITLIVNPISGYAGRYRAKLDAIRYAKQWVVASGDRLDLYLTRHVGHATALAQMAVAQGVDLVIAIGGDGTVNEVARGLLSSQTALGIVPMGSGNGLARHLDLSLIAKQALRTILERPPIAMDCGEIDGQRFFTTAGIGFDAEIGWMFANLGRRGINSYIKATTQLFFHYAPRDYEIEIDGTVSHHKALLITFANASQFGNNARIAPSAVVNDGLLQMVIVRPFPKIAIGYLALLLFHGLVDVSMYVDTIPFKQLRIRCQGALRGHVDGEPIELPNEFEVKVCERVLQIVPGEHAREVSGERAPAILVPYQYWHNLPRPAAIAKQWKKLTTLPLLKKKLHKKK